MDPRTQALAVDFVLAVGTLSLGAFAAEAVFSPASLALGTLGCLLLVGTLYLLEQQAPLQFTAESRLLALSVSFVATFAVWTGLVLWGLVASPAGTVLVGTGLGLLFYRCVFGIIRPLPDQRLAQAELLSGDDGDEIRRPR